MKNRSILLILCLIPLFLMQSCNKKSEAPELSDSVYTDLKSELDISTKQETEMQAQLTKDVKAYKDTPAQSGMYTLNRNKMSTTENLLTMVQQQKKFFEIKLEQRKNEVRSRYLESLKKEGRPWPDPKEIADYKIRMKLQRDKFQWDTNSVPRGTDKDAKNKKASKPSAGGGGEHGEKPAGGEHSEKSEH